MSALATPSPRPPEDRCPGALRAHRAADGLLVRVRLPGGQLRPGQLRVLADLARVESDGALELTSRGNLQLRRLADDASVRRVADRIAEVGLLPTATHERVRNLLASPLSGRDRAGRLDVRPMVRDLDAALRGAADLASLSGRFLFALDDGRHDVAALGADLCWTGDSQVLWLAGTDTGLRAGPEDAVELLIAAARAFLRVRGDRRDLWRLADLPDGPARVTAALRPDGTAVPAELPSAPSGSAPAPAVGLHPGGVLVAGTRLGRLTADQAELLADLAGTDEIVVTPWRSLVLDTEGPDIVGRLATAGLLVDPASPWLGVTACTGRPGCASALADVRRDVTGALADAGTAGGAALPAHVAALPVHVVGCERGCGRPAGPAVLAVATGTGYRIEAGGTSRPGTPAAALAARAERQK
ncbi:precorrin-3B synthase [Plantactinospora sp. BC1]|uniref:precorrin-3B synthase n=1 Tax=Plantactinospora sp. BC1 TaxID=2108470 RepID=UPI000D16F66D|nr:precorrin-3B synthase [Plantactinospora sp. BC1]AVT29501.1 precorrin-3B synthase [Plantactinospora sp. BC1]